MEIRIIPIHGYGWSTEDMFIDVPSPFELEVRQLTRRSNSPGFSMLVGRINGPHDFENYWAVLFPRTKGDSLDYNIQIYAKEVSVDAWKRDFTTDDAMTVGFAMLDDIIHAG